MKIKYESTKRKKDIARSKIAYQKYAKSIDEPIELQIYEELHRFFHKENYPVAGAIQDATSLYYAFQSIYNLAAKYKYYIDNEHYFSILSNGCYLLCNGISRNAAGLPSG